ncbi:type IV toxin-antitoxin system AbiEi family antitoxin domain-containing protein [Cellulosimicrobium funkei]|uniref:type IV toxin-antitoxin system AbiEi family antitoxin domain-containing protein n=1 Tax=Cellulosimicrobium funkei TaxID=264251 RepID=UPI00378D0356
MHAGTAVPAELLRIASRQAGLVTTAQAGAAGLSRGAVRGLVDRREWRRAAMNVYEVRSSAVTSLDDRRRRAALLGLLAYGADAVAVGACALVLHGVEGLPHRLTPQVALDEASRRQHRDGVRLRQFDDGMRTTTIDGFRVATLDRALAQAVPELPRPHGLAVLDAVQRLRLLAPDELARAHDLARGRRGIATRHDLWELSDGRAESPLESFARLECIEEEVPPDTLQLPVRDETGAVVARGDMGWRRRGGRWLVAELDGREHHDTPVAVFTDRRRQNLLTGSGTVDLLRFTSRDLGRVAATVRRHLSV